MGHNCGLNGITVAGMIYYKLGTPWKWDFGTEWRVAFEFLFAENFPDDAFVNGFWTRLKWYRVKPVSWSWVIRNQFRILGKIRRHVYILTILYPLSEHLGIVCNFFYSLVLWRIANPLSLFVLRASCRRTEVSCSFLFQRTDMCSERLWSGVCGPALKERLGGEAWPGILMLRPQVHAATSCLHPSFHLKSTRLFFWSLLHEYIYIYFCHFVLLRLLLTFLFSSPLLPLTPGG